MKKFETIYTAILADLKQWITENPAQQKGEFVVIVAAQVEKSTQVKEEHNRLLRILLSEFPLKQAVSLDTKISDLPSKKLYALALAIQRRLPPPSD